MNLTSSLSRRAVAELIGTGLLLAAIVGSGIMAERLTADTALALLANTAATAAALVALLLAFGPVSGAHLNPAVTLVEAVSRRLPWADALVYGAAQLLGAIGGVALAHAMFGHPLFAASQHARHGWSQGLSELTATFGLVAVILGCARSRPAAVPFAVAAYIASAYWFTASTSFANPAVTVARSLTDTFSGIRPADAPLFIAAQLVGALAAAALWRWFDRPAEAA